MTTLNFDFDVEVGPHVNTYNESVRLLKELMPKPPRESVRTKTGMSRYRAAKAGIDPRTCSFADLNRWNKNPLTNKSVALQKAVNALVLTRFPTKTTDYKLEMSPAQKKLMDITEGSHRNELEFIGEAGFKMLSTYDKSQRDRNWNRNKAVVKRDGEVAIRRK